MELSRRDFLRAAAAAGIAGCSLRLPGGHRITGSIVGGAHSRGHLVRDGVRPAPRHRGSVRVAILGGGIAGLSAAWTLERAGLSDFVVLELEDAPGGTARSGFGPIGPYPWGAHYVPVPSPVNRPLVALLEEVGAVSGRDAQGLPIYAEQVLCRDPQERLFVAGEWHEGLFPRAGASREDLDQLERFEAEMRRWAEWRDERGRRAFAVPRVYGSDAAAVRALDSIPMERFLVQRGLTSERLRWFVEYACRDDFGTTLAETSAWAGVHYFASRRDGSSAEPAELLTWPEGNGRLVRHLAGCVATRMRTSAVAFAVTPRPEAVEVLWMDTASGEATALEAEAVVFALPRFLVRPLLAPLGSAGNGEFVYGSWVVANLTLSDRPASRGFPLAWDNVIYQSPSLGYVVATHQAGADQGPTVLTWYFPICDPDPRAARARLLASTWEEWVNRILADLAPAHPGIAKLVERIDIYLWGHAMVRPRPGFLWSEALTAARQPLPRVHFAHTDLSGMALFEEAQYWGIHAAEALMTEVGHPFRSWLA